MEKIVKPYWENLITLYCSCPGCEDKLVVTAEKKFYTNIDNFYFDIQYEDPPNLWQRIKKAWRFVRGWREIQLNYDSLLLDTDEVEELAKALLERVDWYKAELRQARKKEREE